MKVVIPASMLAQWAFRLNIDENRLSHLVTGGDTPANIRERDGFVRFLLTVEPSEERSNILDSLLMPSPPEFTEGDVVAAAAAATISRAGLKSRPRAGTDASKLQIVADRLWNAAVRRGEDLDIAGEHIGALLRLGKYNQQRQDIVEDPAISELRDLFLARELIAAAILAPGQLAMAHTEIQRRRMRLHREIVGQAKDELTPTARIQVALAELRACADLTAEDLDEQLGRPAGWYSTQLTTQEFTLADIATLKKVLELDRVRTLPSWLTEAFTAALGRASRSITGAMLDGEQLAGQIGVLLAAARDDLGFERDVVARQIHVHSDTLRKRESGKDFKSFRGLRVCRDAANLYIRSRWSEELNDALNQYSDLLHIHKFAELRETRTADVDDKTLVVAVLLHALKVELGISETDFRKRFNITKRTARELTSPTQAFDAEEWAAVAAVGAWVRDGVVLTREKRANRQRTSTDSGNAGGWPVQSLADVDEFSRLRGALGLSVDPKLAILQFAPAEPRAEQTRKTPTLDLGKPATDATSTRRAGQGSTLPPATRKARVVGRASEMTSSSAEPTDEASPRNFLDAEQMWWQVAAITRVRFGLPLTHLIEPDVLERLLPALDGIDTGVLCALANGQGASLSEEDLANIVTASDRRIPSANLRQWIVPIGRNDDPVVLYTHLLRGWAASRLMTPAVFKFAFSERVTLPRSVGVDDQLFKLSRGLGGNTRAERVNVEIAREQVTNFLLDPHSSEPWDLPRVFGSARSVGSMGGSQQLEPLSVLREPGVETPLVAEARVVGAPDEQAHSASDIRELSPEQESAFLAGAGRRVSVWLTKVPIEVVSDSELSAPGRGMLRQRYALRRQASRPDQDITFVVGHSDMVAVIGGDAVEAWLRPARGWFRRNSHLNPRPANEVPQPEGLADNFEILTDVQGIIRVINLDGDMPTLITDEAEVKKYSQWATALAANTQQTSEEKRQTGEVELAVENADDQQWRDGRLRDWYNNLSDQHSDLILDALTGPQAADAIRYFLDGEPMKGADFAEFRRALRRAQQKTSPNPVELRMLEIVKVFGRAKATDDAVMERAAEIVERAIEELDDAQLREVLRATVVEGQLTREYAEEVGLPESAATGRRIRGLSQVSKLLGWLPPAELAIVRGALSEVRPGQDKSRRSSRGDKRNQLAHALGVLGDDVEEPLRATAELLLAHPDANFDEIGQMHDPKLTAEAVLSRSERLLKSAEMRAQGLPRG